jgi:HAD superfamily hydrolase (TIGR01490 family)
MSVYRSRARGAAKGAAFYDVDGTLMGLNLVHAALFMLANVGEWSGRAGGLLSFAARLPLLYMAERRDRYLLNAALFAAFKGLSRDRLEVLGEEYCDRILIAHLFPQATAMIEANRTAGLEPILVTGSPDFIIAPLAAHLNITTFVANRLVYSRGRATGRLHEPIMAGDAKAAWCGEYAAANRLDLKSCWGYADSYHDLAFLAAMGHPVAVNPDRKLREIARGRQWPVINFAKPGRANQLAASGTDALEQWIERNSNGAAGI